MPRLHRSINFSNFSTSEMHEWAKILAQQQEERTGKTLEAGPPENQIVERWTVGSNEIGKYSQNKWETPEETAARVKQEQSQERPTTPSSRPDKGREENQM